MIILNEFGGLNLKQFDIIIIGGGPAGLFSAIMCAGSNKKVAVLEKNKSCGRKLLMTGAGKCNLTQAGEMNHFLECFGKNAKFLKPALLTFSNDNLLQFFHKRGMNFITQENGKIFPKSLKAQDVLDLFLSECQKLKINIITETEVQSLTKEDLEFSLKTNKETYLSQQVIVATGGMSYPHTGSTGDGQRFAKALGHKITPMKPALTPLKIKNYALADLSGQSFENLTYTLWRQGKKVGTYQGDVLLTHTGVSGPGILNPSRDMQSKDLIKLNFLGREPSEFCQEFTKHLNNNGKTLVKTIVRELDLTRRFCDKILELAEISDNLKCAELKKGQRRALLTLLTEYEMEIKELGGYQMAMVTAGGVSFRDIHPKTMESRKVKGLYFIGEVVDIDGDTGGYNLQAAFSTAYLAAKAVHSLEVKKAKIS